MKLFNRTIVFFKKTFSKKLYFVMLFIIVLLTTIYKLLPEKSKTADIKVAICSMDDSYYNQTFFKDLLEKKSIYKYYQVDSKENLLNDVKAGKAECGYYIPDDFFVNYINGQFTNKIKLYVIPSTTLDQAINESIFSSIFSACSNDILLYGMKLPEYDMELSLYMDAYLAGDEIFTMEDSVNGEYDYQSKSYTIDIPLFEVVILLTLFAALLALYNYITDCERKIYLSLKCTEKFQILSLYILTAIFPITLTGVICALIYGYAIKKVLFILLFALCSYILCAIISLIIKRSTLLSKVLPIIMLISIAVTFVTYLI